MNRYLLTSGVRGLAPDGVPRGKAPWRLAAFVCLLAGAAWGEVSVNVADAVQSTSDISRAPPLEPASEAERRALFVAVGDYPGSRFDLYGPTHDASALRRELVENLGFRADRVKVLVNADATRANILAALRELAAAVAAEDFVFVYFSGHGTSAYDPNLSVALAHNTGAFVPFDYRADGTAAQKLDTLVVGSRDLRPPLTAIDASGAHGLVMIDSCYSRNTSRSLHAAAPPVYRSINAGLEHLGAFSASAQDVDASYPYTRLVTMAASSAKEVAIDLHDPSKTLDGKPHGAFTDAVLRALREFPHADANGDGQVSNREFFAKVKLGMALANIPHSPQLLPTPGTDAAGLGDRAMFSSAAVRAEAPPPLPAQPLGVRVEGRLPLVAQAVAASETLVPADGSADLLVRRAQGAIHLLTPYGDAVASVATQQAAADALRQRPWIRHLVHRLGQRDHSDVQLALPGETFEDGDVLNLAATLRRSAHLLVLDIAPSGSLRVLYPASERDFRAVPAARRVAFDAVVNAPFGVDYMVASAFPQAPRFFDHHLLADAEIAPGTPLHRELVRAVEAPDTPSAVAKVVTVPRGQRP